MMQQFPLKLRLMDFLLLSLILLVFAALQAGVRWGWQRSRVLGLGLGALILSALPVAYSTTRHNLPPYSAEDAKSLLAELAQVRRPTEAVYVHYSAGQYLRCLGHSTTCRLAATCWGTATACCRVPSASI